ncbi:MAG: hypothetical protein JWP95_628 [Actinotalea sp.]|nr:hypothetical protein [Actinotalea sp.]
MASVEDRGRASRMPADARQSPPSRDGRNRPSCRAPRRSSLLAGAVVLNLVVLPVALVQARDAVARGAVSRQDAAAATTLHRLGEDVLVQLLDAETGQRGYLLTGDPAYLDPYTVASATLGESTAALEAAGDAPEQAARAARIAALTEAKLEEIGRSVALYDASGELAARVVLEQGEGRALMEEIRAEVEDLVAAADAQATGSAVLADAEQRLARMIALLASIFVAGNLVAMLVLLRQRERWEQQRELLVQELEDLAVRDPLTGVLNRRTLEGRVHEAVSRALAEGSDVAVHYIDLNGFKPVNDLLGHETGDHVLTTIARQLQEALRDGDAVSRVGGDEFVVVMEAFPQGPAAEALLRRLAGATTVVVDPAGLSAAPGDDQALVVTASIGRATLCQDEMYAAGGRDAVLLARRLLAAADADMYTQKIGQHPVRLGDDDMAPAPLY